MSYIIAAIDEHNGIGRDGKIPWMHTEYGRQDMRFFSKMTKNNAVLMGWNTYVSIGKLLPDRLNIIVTGKHETEAPPSEDGICAVFADPDQAIQYGRKWEIQTGKCCFIIGGEQIFRYYLTRYNPKKTFITLIPGKYECDTFYPGSVQRPTGVESSVHNLTFEHRSVKDERQYLDLFDYVLANGHIKEDRTGTGTVSVFSPPELRFSLEHNTLPVLTTKTVAIKTGVIPELLWFISGSTDTRILEKKGCNIWKGNTSKEFLEKRGLTYQEKDMGPGYGFQWRHSGAEYHGMEADYTDKGVDQLQSIVNHLIHTPDSRRMLMCSWTAPYISQMALPPCHILYQVYTHTDKNGVRRLSAKMYQRSADSFLGVPFNITSYALLTHMLGALTGYVPYELVLTFGDYHIYRNHMSQVSLQQSREPRGFPKLFFKRDIRGLNISEVTEQDFEIVGYSPYGHITAPMAV
jgi:thymidylate synthase